jgi:hypothetical protein
MCATGVDWCEARGLDADYLGEPDGPSEFVIIVETAPGKSAVKGPRTYE